LTNVITFVSSGSGKTASHVRIEYEQTPDDWAEFGEYCALNASQLRNAARNGVQNGTILFLMVFGAIAYFAKSWLAVVVGVALAAFWTWHWPRQLIRDARKSMAANDAPCLRGRHVLEALPEGLRAQCDVAETTTRWAGIHSIGETDTHVFVMLSEVQGYTIPRSRIVSGDLSALLKAVKLYRSR
jgi:hypothetical protein